MFKTGKNLEYGDQPMPFKVWFLRVDEGHRIRFPADAQKVITWLKADSGNGLGCVANLGARKGLQLSPLPTGGRAFEARKELVNRLQENPAKTDEVTQEWMDLVRFFATVWFVQIHFEPKVGRFSFTLPEKARQLGIVPSEHQEAVVFSTGDVLEVWRADEWKTQISNMSSILPSLLPSALASLEGRNVSSPE